MSTQRPANHPAHSEWPSVTVVFLVYNRHAELRECLERMTRESDYDPERIEVIVVDNASTDGSSAMVREEFPRVQLMVRDRNVGASGWNEGLAVARGDYVLILDDDCFLPPDGLRRAVAAAEKHHADLVSFKVVSTYDTDHVFTEDYLTGLFSFWGCAVLMRRQVVEALGGYDPEIFIWANELEFMLRFFDRGFRHLHYPDVVAQHMKAPPEHRHGLEERAYRLNARHWAYIPAKLFDLRHAAQALIALLLRAGIDGIGIDRAAFRAIPDIFSGFRIGLRHRAPLHNRQLSSFYCDNFVTYAAPWWLLRSVPRLRRSLPQLIREFSRETLSQGLRIRNERVSERAIYYPEWPALLEFVPWPRASAVAPGPRGQAEFQGEGLIPG